MVKYDEIWWWNIVKCDLDKWFFVKHCFHHYVHLCVFVVFTTVHVRRLEKVAIPILQTKYHSMIYVCSNYSSFVPAMLPKKARKPLSNALVHQHGQTFASLFLPPAGIWQTFRPSWSFQPKNGVILHSTMAAHCQVAWDAQCHRNFQWNFRVAPHEVDLNNYNYNSKSKSSSMTSPFRNACIIQHSSIFIYIHLMYSDVYRLGIESWRV